jgi:preprotein translocase subunit SecY
MFLMWLGEQITSRGIGNGISLIIFAGIVANIPSAIAGTLELGRQGALSTALILGVIVLAVGGDRLHRFHGAGAAAAADPVPEAADRQPDVSGRFLAPAAEAQHRRRDPADLRLVAAVAAHHRRQLFGRIRPGLAFNGDCAPGNGQPLHMLFYGGLIVFFAFFYTAVVFNPKDTADQLKKHGGFVPGIRPGQRTAEYIDYVLTRITVVGAIYLVLVCLCRKPLSPRPASRSISAGPRCSSSSTSRWIRCSRFRVISWPTSMVT